MTAVNTPCMKPKDEALNNAINVQESNNILELDTQDISHINFDESLHKNIDENNCPTSLSLLDFSLRKRLKQSRLAFKNNEKKANATVAENSATTLMNNTSADEDVIEASPTQISRASIVKEYLKLKRKIPVKHLDFRCPSPKHTSTQMEANAIVAENSAATLVNNISADEDVIEASPTQISRASIVKEYLKLKRKIPVKHLDFGCPSPKHTSTQIEDKSLINTPVNTLKDQSNISCNINDFACEDETFYLPAEQVANINDMDDTENKLPEKKMLLNNFNVRLKRKVITKHLNMRCKADRAKLKGSDCWECREYYNKLGLSEEQLQKRKNQISRHRYKYERPNTPPGFWDPEYPETGTY